MGARARWAAFLRAVRVVVRHLRYEQGVAWPQGFRLHVRCMSREESRREGFAVYQGRTLRLNRAALRLTRSDWIVLILHEVGGHHLQTIRQASRHRDVRDTPATLAAEERCATLCEKKWARAFGVRRAARQWWAYRRARAALDAAEQKLAQRGGPPLTAAAARRVFRRHGVPRRLVRANYELTRVRQHPGQVRGYVHGRVRGAPDCPCA